MKTLKLFFAVVLLLLSFVACSDSNDAVAIDENPLSEMVMLKSLKANAHTIEVYSDQEQFTIGYNELFIRIKDDATDAYVSNAEITWSPVMHMTTMMHSCPKSTITTTNDDSVYSGYIVFQMPGNTDEYWDLTLNYTINNQEYSATERIEVNSPLNDRQTVSVFTGTDNVRYVLAMAPLDPKVAVNDMSALLFKMESMMIFPVVENYSVALDPRMPSMGNHSSPNNVNLSYDSASKMYNGKLSLTMTGYWKLNLKLLNASGDVLKGEDITTDNESSSLFFEIEF